MPKKPAPVEPTDRLSKLMEKLANVQSQIKAEESAIRQEQRLLEDHKKFSVGGHFLAMIELHAAGLTGEEPGSDALNLPEETLAKAMKLHMLKNMKTAHHRKVLGLPALPAPEKAIATTAAANDAAPLKADFDKKKKA